MARCKFRCESITLYSVGISVTLHPVTANSEENKTFYSNTPGGELKLEILNPEISTLFQPGKEYYIDISKVI